MDAGIVRDGWLLKSPPEKSFCRAVNLSSLRPKWHKRWFVLKHSGDIPGQYRLEYFTDETCRKLKGQIDLDQCERVETGLNFNNKKYNYHFMFDIRTPKRIYYLVAKSQEDMNKWVECICSVCGLKHEEEEETRRNMEPTNITVQLTANTAPASLAATPAPSATNLTTVPSESSPYIPISECITGKPIKNPLKGSTKSSDNLNLVMLPMRRSSMDSRDIFNSDFYDHPRSVCVPVHHQTQVSTPDLYRVPPVVHMHTKSYDRGEWDNAFIDDDSLPLCPPFVNWKTHPHEPTPDKPFDLSTYDVPVNANHTANPSFGISETPSTTEYKMKGHKYVRCEKVKSKDSNVSNFTAVNGSTDPPPRPPKPPFLDKRKYENFDPDVESKPAAPVGLYDVPPSNTAVTKENNKTKSLHGEIFSFSKEESHSTKDLSPSVKVPLSATSPTSPSQMDNSLDDMYDFPRSRLDSRSTLPSKSAIKARSSRQHAYSNAPPGCLNAKDSILNYEYRPCLATDSPNDVLESDVSLDAESPLSPQGATGGMYANITSPVLDGLVRVPPQINRELKPKKKVLEYSDSVHSAINLAPPPAPKSNASKFSMGMAKQRAAPSPTPGSGLPSTNLPAIPYRPSHSDHSDEELSSCGSNSRRNSANDEPAKHWVPPAARKIGGEIQYLELDMDSDSGLQIPRSPDRSSSSTVYKTVDFMKTKVFNEMRQNCEESYRKSQ